VTPSTRLVLDTSAYSQLRAGHQGVGRVVAGAAVVMVPATVLGELEAAFLLGSRLEDNRRTLAEFLSEPFVGVLEVGTVTAQYYGRVFADLRRAGTPIPLNDVWIAASTLECTGHLLTFDKDFKRVEGLSVTLLESGNQ